MNIDHLDKIIEVLDEEDMAYSAIYPTPCRHIRRYTEQNMRQLLHIKYGHGLTQRWDGPEAL